MANETLNFSSTNDCQLEIGSGLGWGLVSASFLKTETSFDLDYAGFFRKHLNMYLNLWNNLYLYITSLNDICGDIIY